MRFDASGRGEGEFFVNVTNVFDADPILLPETGLAANSTYSDLLGTAFRVGVRAERALGEPARGRGRRLADPAARRVMSDFPLRDGVVHCEDVPLPLIAAAVGTPVFVYSAGAMRGQARALLAALSPLRDPLVAYAVKANPNGAVLRTWPRKGSAPTSFPAANIAGRGPRGSRPTGSSFPASARPPRKWRWRWRAGSFSSTSNRCRRPRCSPRSPSRWGGPRRWRSGSIPMSRPAATPRSRPARRTTSSAFPIDDAPAACARVAALPGLRLNGLAVHIGSQLTSLAPLETAFRKLGAMIADTARAGARDSHRRSRRRSRPALRSLRAGAADDRRLWRDGRPADARLGCAADLRARPADRRRCRRPPDRGHPGQGGRDEPLRRRSMPR